MMKMWRVCPLLVALLVAPSIARADDDTRPLVLVHRELPAAKLLELQRAAAPRGVVVAAPEAPPEPASETLLADVRPLYRDMAFGRASARLDAAAETLVRRRLPTAGTVRALAEIELWRGACRALAGDRRGASEHFVLARQLWPAARLEPIFPPKVQALFGAARPGEPVPVEVRIAPSGAHLWLDGREVTPPVTATPGLHYIVVMRADRVPEARLTRLLRAAAEISVSLREPAPIAEALRSARWWALDDAVAESVGRPLFSVELVGARFRVAAVPVHAGVLVESERADEVVAGVCQAAGTCLGPRPVIAVAPPLATAPPSVSAPPTASARPPRPLWRRAWFWGVVGAGALVAAGIATGVALGVTAQTDYVVRLR
jgi:hypothetical protein